MAWAKASEELNELHTSLVESYPCVKKKMFGFQVFFVNDNMFTGVYENGVMLRLNPADREAALAQSDEVVPFTPMGRTMKEYVWVPESMLSDHSFGSKWFEKSYQFVASLPPKVKKEKKKPDAPK